MLSLKDCIDMCGLTEDEVAAIAEEANLPPIVAVLVGSNLLRSEAGLNYPAKYSEIVPKMQSTATNPR